MFALDERKTIIPVFYQDCTIPLQLRRVQYIDFRTDYAQGLTALFRILGVEHASRRTPAESFAVPKGSPIDLRTAYESERTAKESRLGQEQRQAAAERVRVEQQRTHAMGAGPTVERKTPALGSRPGLMSALPVWAKVALTVCGILVVGSAVYWASSRLSSRRQPDVISPASTQSPPNKIQEGYTGNEVKIVQTVEVERYWSEDGKTLQAIALFAMQNASNPPRTWDSDHTFEFVLPAGAQLDSSQAKGPGGQPIASTANATEQNYYAFAYPLKPGETQFEVSYHMPYKGEASISPQFGQDVRHFVVMTPMSMTFTPQNPQQFQSMPDKSGARIMVATDVKPART